MCIAHLRECKMDDECEVSRSTRYRRQRKRLHQEIGSSSSGFHGLGYEPEKAYQNKRACKAPRITDKLDINISQGKQLDEPDKGALNASSTSDSLICSRSDTGTSGVSQVNEVHDLDSYDSAEQISSPVTDEHACQIILNPNADAQTKSRNGQVQSLTSECAVSHSKKAVGTAWMSRGVDNADEIQESEIRSDQPNSLIHHIFSFLDASHGEAASSLSIASISTRMESGGSACPSHSVRIYKDNTGMGQNLAGHESNSSSSDMLAESEEAESVCNISIPNGNEADEQTDPHDDSNPLEGDPHEGSDSVCTSSRPDGNESDEQTDTFNDSSPLEQDPYEEGDSVHNSSIPDGNESDEQTDPHNDSNPLEQDPPRSARPFNSDDDEGDDEDDPDNDDPPPGNDPPDPHGNDNEDEHGEGIFNFSFNHPSLDVVLECRGEETARDALVLGLAMSVRHCWTYECLIDHFQNENSLLGTIYLPTCKSQLWKLIDRSNAGIRAHAYCNKCKKYIGSMENVPDVYVCNGECDFQAPKNKLKYFLTLSLRKQLQHFLATPGIAAHLRYRDVRRKHNPNAIADIFDGREYKRLQRENILSADDFSYVFNTDGFKVLRNSKLQAWPIYIRINELPPNLRQKYLFIAGIWIDPEEPDMNCFFDPFVEQANDLSRNGTLWKPGGINEISSKFIPTCQCVDSKARSILLHMTSFSGYYGCTNCDHIGVWEEGAMRYPILPRPGMPEPQDRTNNSIVQDMHAAQDRGTPVRGVKGPAILMTMNHFGLLTGSASDDLHPLYEGNAAHLTELLLITGRIAVAEKIRIIDNRLKTIKTPSGIARKPMMFKKRAQWKGSEWRNWLFYYSIPCLKGLIPQKYMELLQRLSYACFLLSQDEILPIEVDLAEQTLLTYVKLFEEYFGVGNMRYNVHLLLHVAQSVRNWGPLWVYSTFNFESWNFQEGKLITSPNGAADQIITRHLIRIHLNNALYSDIGLSEATLTRLASLLNKPRRKVAYQVDNVYFLGNEEVREPTPEENAVLQNEHLHIEVFSVFSKILFRSTTYISCDTVDPSGRSDDSIIYTWDNTFCTALRFVKYMVQGQERCGLFAIEHDVDAEMPFAQHVGLLRREDLLHFMPVDGIRCPAVKVRVGEETSMIPVPNQCEVD